MLPHILVEKLLELDECILSVMLVNMNGQIVDYKSKYHIPHKAVTTMDHDGMWIRAAYAMLDQCTKNFGKIQAFVSLHEKAKLLALPVPNINALLLLTVIPSANTEYITSKVESLMANPNLASRFHDDCNDNFIAPDRNWLKR